MWSTPAIDAFIARSLVGLIYRMRPRNVDGPNILGNDSRVLPQPFAHTERRTLWLRATLLAATFLGLLASLPVWLNTRTFPLLPIFSGFPILPAPLDTGLYAVMLISLLAAMWFYRPAVIVFLGASFFAYCGDQNRGQPWLYMYWVMLLLSVFRSPAASAACRIAIAAVYFWSGIQKINPRFFQVTPDWFVAPALNWHLPSGAIDLLKLSVKAAPFIEIAIGLLLWFPKLRRIAFALTILTHAFALLFLGPLGHNYNWVVWPWNLAMIALVLSLFAKGKIFELPRPAPTSEKAKPICSANKNTPPPAASGDAFGLTTTHIELWCSRAALVVVALYSLLPILSYSGRWDSYFSFSLYSENLAVANIFVTESFRANLPPQLQRHVETFPQAYDPEHQGPLLFVFPNWAYEELHVPTLFEPRNFVNIYRALQPYAQTPADLRMIIGPRSGPVIFREGERVEFLQRAK
jgi:uncharacterized membrane protein YphA (DoxX/SURF4 family)